MKQKLLYILLSGTIAATLQAQTVSFGLPADDSREFPEQVAVAGKNSAFVYSTTGEDDSIFENSPEYDVAKALYGVLPGLNVNQGSGPNANNFSVLSLHGNSPMVLIDGFPRSLSDITASEIESVSVLNDATAAAIYGVKGANGVILVTTKRGANAPLKVTAKYNYGFATPFRAPDFADSYTYARSLNEAMTLDGLTPKYKPEEVELFRTGEYKYYYPNVDWMKEVYKNISENHRLSLTFRGGSKRFRYYSTVDYLYDNSLYRNRHTDDRYNANQYNSRLGVRTNVDVDITKSTFLTVGLSARISQNNRSRLSGVEGIIYTLPSAAFPVWNEDGSYGGSAIYSDKNPVARINDSGVNTNTQAMVMADMNLKQDFSDLVKGLSADVSFAFDYLGNTVDASNKEFAYTEVRPTLLPDGSVTTESVHYGLNSQTLGHSSWQADFLLRSEIQGKINYDYDSEAHHVDAHLIYRQRSLISDGRNTSSKTQEAMAVANYNYRNRYFVNVVANYSGSSYLKKGERFSFYPAVSIGWDIAQENFMKNAKAIDRFKIFASYGKSGYDGNLQHELYLQTYGGANAGNYFFTQGATSFAGQAEGNLPAEKLTPEVSVLGNVGLNMEFLGNRLSLQGMFFKERRSGILVEMQNVSGIIGIGTGLQNIGENIYTGGDFKISWNDRRGDFKYGIYAVGSFVTSKIIENGEAYKAYDYLYKKGNKVGQAYGLEVIGIFQNTHQINNSPAQTFSTVRPGDLMYKDQNNDGVINSQDEVKMFGSNIPLFNFGFGLRFGYENFEISAAFQGRTGVTVNLLSSPLYSPLVDNGTISDTFLDREIPWSPERAEEATMPRLTSLQNENNYHRNSLWYRDGSFIKLRNLTVSYTFPKKMLKFADMKLFLQGTNLFSLDNIKFADPEQLSAAYPATRAFWAGVKFTF